MARSWNWKIDTDSGEKVQGKSGLTRFVGWINAMLNPNHAWFDYDNLDNTLFSVQNQLTKEHQTGAEVEAQNFEAAEAEKARAWEEEMSNTAFQRQVKDMQSAGVNPALMYGGGFSGASTPSSPVASGQLGSNGLSMSDLVQLMMLPIQKDLAKAQIENTYATADKSRAETELTKKRTENMMLVNQYYPEVTEANLQKTLSSIGVDLSTIDKNDVQAALTNVQKLIADKENKYAEEYFKYRADYENAKSEEARASAAARAAEALMTGYEYKYATENGAKLSSSSLLALVSAIGEFTGLSSPEVRNSVRDVVGTAVKESTEPFGMYKEAGRRFGAKFRSGYRKFRNWVGKEKKAPWVK